MTWLEVKEFYKSCYRFHKQTGMSMTNWTRWKAKGFVTIKGQMMIEASSGGLLKARIEDLK